MFGRTFFEDSSNGRDYAGMARSILDGLFADGFDWSTRDLQPVKSGREK